MLDSQQLKVFVLLAKFLNMSRAARELGITPSGVSHCIKTLEEDLGCRLFERSSRKISLSSAGQQLLPEAEAILDQMRTARARMKTKVDWRKGHFRVAANTTACQYILPPVLREFLESFPEYKVKIDQAEAQATSELIAEGKIDLALTIEPAKIHGLQFIPIAEDQLMFMVHPLHPWTSRQNFQNKVVSQENLILPERSSDTYGLIKEYFLHDNILISPFIEIANEEAIKQFVRLDLGIGIVPTWIALAEIKQGYLKALAMGRRKLVRRWGILAAKGREFSFAENLFIGICRNTIKELFRSVE